jgi:hypothetical protein
MSVLAAVVSLAGTNSETLTSVDGSFELAPVVPGRYTLVVSDTTLAEYTSPRSTQLMTEVMRGRLTKTRVELPPLADVIRDICRDQRMPRGTSMIVGRVVGASRPAGRIVARWQAGYNSGSPVASDKDVGRTIAINGAEQRVDLDDQGHFVVCGVARGRPVHLRYMENQRFTDTTIFVGDTLLHPVEWRPILPPHTPESLDLSVIERKHFSSDATNPLMWRRRRSVWRPGSASLSSRRLF